jgi:hypothetical protein
MFDSIIIYLLIASACLVNANVVGLSRIRLSFEKTPQEQSNELDWITQDYTLLSTSNLHQNDSLRGLKDVHIGIGLYWPLSTTKDCYFDWPISTLDHVSNPWSKLFYSLDLANEEYGDVALISVWPVHMKCTNLLALYKAAQVHATRLEKQWSHIQVKRLIVVLNHTTSMDPLLFEQAFIESDSSELHLLDNELLLSIVIDTMPIDTSLQDISSKLQHYFNDDLMTPTLTNTTIQDVIDRTKTLQTMTDTFITLVNHNTFDILWFTADPSKY